MPKIHNTHKQLREQLFERISPLYLFNYTSIFNDPIGGTKLDAFTVEYIKAQYANYWVSWVEKHAKKFILNEKIPV